MSVGIQAVSTIANAASACLAVVAAGLWIKSATVSVPAPKGVGLGGVLGGGLFYDDERGMRTDAVETSRLQAKWNRMAAIWAAGAASCQAIVAGLGFFSGN